MTNIATDIRQLIAARLEKASPVEILRIASSLAANEQIDAISTGHAMRQVAAIATGPRFINLGSDGKPTAGEHVAVYDSQTKLTWTRGVLSGSRNWKDSLAAAKAVRLFGAEDWRAPTLQERFAINDYTKHSPALDTAHFTKESGWEWTSTIDAESPSGCAWVVGLGGGDCGRDDRGYDGHVRAVRAGQQLALSV